MMSLTTKIATITTDGVLDLAKKTLFDKGVIAIPTETVYGLAAKLYPDAIAKIYEIKNRPQDNPLIVHIYNEECLLDLVSDINDCQKQLMKAFWPGALTILFKVNPSVPKEVTAGLNTIAIRCPSHPITREILKICGPLAAPSANSSGKPSPTLPSHVYTDLNGKIPLIIDGGPCSVGLESTVCNPLSTPPCILRPGIISLQEIQQVPGMQNCVNKQNSTIIQSPGMKYKHYEPSIPVFVVCSSTLNLTFDFPDNSAIITDNSLPISTTTTNYKVLKGDHLSTSTVKDINFVSEQDFLIHKHSGSIGVKVDNIRHSLYHLLRVLDGENGFEQKSCIFVFINSIVIKEDVYNRLFKASSHFYIN